MAFDGITIANIVRDLQHDLDGGRIYKVAQTETDELFITVKTNVDNIRQRRIFMSADASLPLIYMTDETKQAPMTAPGFCMLLRKHIQNGRILSITQPGLERIVRIEVEHMDEMGDMRQKTLLIELMGKYSNIIFVDEEEIHRLNKEYRNVDRKTDVISFALEDEVDDYESPLRVLGDIYICINVAYEQAKEYGHSDFREVCFLATHGLLHLLGYDHMEKSDEVVMFGKQEELLKDYDIIR